MEKMIFFNGGWMSFYDGLGSDKISGGGAYIEKHEFGGEVYNFRNCGGKNYGYVMTRSGTINLRRIDVTVKRTEELLNNVTCVFIAKHPKGGRRIVGWYRDAVVYSRYQSYVGKDREIMVSQEDWDSDFNQVGYFAQASNNNSVLLTEDERVSAPLVPNGKNGAGQSNVWYADSDLGYEFRQKITKFIAEYESNMSLEAASEQKRKNYSVLDIDAKKKVEQVAIQKTIDYYEALGYSCKSVESENYGWDIECKNDKINLLIEVKGLSKSDISIRLTRNEYEKMINNKEHYRLSVVTKCLDYNIEPAINIFSFISEKNGWFDKFGNELYIEEIVEARCKIK